MILNTVSRHRPDLLEKHFESIVTLCDDGYPAHVQTCAATMICHVVPNMELAYPFRVQLGSKLLSIVTNSMDESAMAAAAASFGKIWRWNLDTELASSLPFTVLNQLIGKSGIIQRARAFAQTDADAREALCHFCVALGLIVQHIKWPNSVSLC